MVIGDMIYCVLLALMFIITFVVTNDGINRIDRILERIKKRR